MEYAIPDSLTIGSYAIGWNTELSALDREFMTKQYPAAVKPVQELAVGGARVAADLASAGETDSYHLVVDEAATYILTTKGATDTVLTLLGPDDAEHRRRLGRRPRRRHQRPPGAQAPAR